MKYINVKTDDGVLKVSQIALGCMRISDMNVKDLELHLRNAIENGINFFDHADIYGKGKSEEAFCQAAKSFSQAAKGINREEIIIQSKCGIRNGMYDFSKEYIINSVDGILRRLGTDYLDVLVLHRPDALVEPEDVAEAFDTLYNAKKVRYFGVSNHNPMQIELLQKYCRQKLIFNQLQLSITNSAMIQSGINVNTGNDSALDRDGSVLDYCRLKDITIQAWSPLQYGFFEGNFVSSDKYPQLNAKLDDIALKYGVTPSAVAISWILRHPAKIQTIVGTTNKGRLSQLCLASNIALTRQEWYEIYRSAGNKLP